MKHKPLLWFAGAAAILVIAAGTAWLKAAPQARTIGAVLATPAYVVVNTPTQVRFTAVITDPAVQPGVNLLKVDAAGKTLANLGAMNDSGVNGDLVAGDKTFSLLVNLNEPSPGEVFYRVSGPFKGVLQRVLSPVLAVDAWAAITGLGLSMAAPPGLAVVDGTHPDVMVLSRLGGAQGSGLWIYRVNDSANLTPEEWWASGPFEADSTAPVTRMVAGLPAIEVILNPSGFAETHVVFKRGSHLYDVLIGLDRATAEAVLSTVR